MRTLYGACALLCATLLAVALYLQHIQGIEPCPLCLIQRVVVIALGAIFLMAACHDPNVAGRRAYGLVPIVLAGGKKLPELDALTMAYKAIDQGANGVDMGRNIFQAGDPIAMIQAVKAVVHDMETPEKAFDLCNTLKQEK